MGELVAIALRPAPDQPMRLVGEVTLDPVRGVVGDYSADRPGAQKRQVTLLSEELWERATTDLEAPDLPWHTRRANLLVRGVELEGLVGQRLELGDAVLHIHGITHPCELMDDLHAGLRAALDQELRCGVFGAILAPATVRPGDRVVMLGPAP